MNITRRTTSLAPSLTFLRTFTSTTPSCAKSTKQRLLEEHSAIPPYPYGPSQWYKQSNFGLYGHSKLTFGNKVSEKNEIKTRRRWRPNVQHKRLWSVSLNRFLRIRLTTRVLRTIDKCGGLDEYLLGNKTNRIKELGMGGWKLRWRIMQTEAVQERLRKEREALGLPALEQVGRDSTGRVATEAAVAEEARLIDEELALDTEMPVGEEMDGDMGEIIEADGKVIEADGRVVEQKTGV